MWRRRHALGLAGSEWPWSLGEWSAVIWKITHRTLPLATALLGKEARSTRAVWAFIAALLTSLRERSRMSMDMGLDMGFMGHSYSRGLPRTARATALHEPTLHLHTNTPNPGAKERRSQKMHKCDSIYVSSKLGKPNSMLFRDETINIRKYTF